MGKHRRAPLPSEEFYENQRAARERARNSATPPDFASFRAPGAMKTYKVTSGCIVHGKKRGDTVELWDTGATRALVQAGHLVEVVEVKDLAEESADQVKEADNG